jgi:hypothetical protein
LTASRRLAASLAALAVVGCSGAADSKSTPEAATSQPTRVVPTPLATERRGLVGGSFYKPPGWDGVSDVNCKDFDTRAHAQSFFVGTHGSRSNDPYGLDGDHDGNACETLP